ncbi:hypothetical protein EVAR_2651_1 [Eumeta japonica]|uniref:Uncharacterized protein n=1 Tax=Eumeta variegata TaxID=151549 RepID=A0A4C1SQ88_EUMVA|nr:hypothetical protein EVAR_2651_1 [Eumeta japonica]
MDVCGDVDVCGCLGVWERVGVIAETLECIAQPLNSASLRRSIMSSTYKTLETRSAVRVTAANGSVHSKYRAALGAPPPSGAA